MSYSKRLAAASNRAAKATRAFEKLEEELLAASRDQREVHDELQVEIDRLTELQEQAQNQGLLNAARAQKIRETFL